MRIVQTGTSTNNWWSIYELDINTEPNTTAPPTATSIPPTAVPAVPTATSIPPTAIPVSTGAAIVSPNLIQAEAYVSHVGIRPVSKTEGAAIGFINNNDSASYTIDVIQAGLIDVNLRATSDNNSGGTVDFILDGVNIGSMNVTSTGGWDDFMTFSSSTPMMIPAAGNGQTLTLEFSGGSGYLLDVNWIEFESSVVAPSPTATSVPPTATAVPPTATVIPPTATSIPPTATATPPEEVSVIVSEDFNNGAGCFGYSDDVFRNTSQPNYASGASSNGRLTVNLGGVNSNNINNMSGGWGCTFTLESAADLSIAFDYFLDTHIGYEPDEYSEVLLSIDGTLYGLNGSEHVVQIAGGGSDGWTSVSIMTPELSAGTHTLILGAFNNKKTYVSESAVAQFDNVEVSTGNDFEPVPVPPTATPEPIEPAENLALGKAVTQSSLGYGGVPERAVDGNSNGVWRNSSVTHTSNGSAAEPSWWEVDLGEQSNIDTISLWGRTDCCTARLSDVTVFVSAQPFVGTTVSSSQNQAGVTAYFFAGELTAETTFAVNETGRYVRVQLSSDSNDPLSLAEVEVLGSVASDVQSLEVSSPTAVALSQTSSHISTTPVLLLAVIATVVTITATHRRYN